MSSHDDARPGPPFPAVLIVVGVVLISINLRPGATSIGPLLEEIGTGLGFSSTTAGVLTALPGFTFAIAGAGADGLARRIGLSRGITLVLAALVFTLLSLVHTHSPLLFVLPSAIGHAGMV